MRAQVRLQADAELIGFALSFCRSALARSADPDTRSGVRVAQLLVMNALHWDVLPEPATFADVRARADAMEEYRSLFGATGPSTAKERRAARRADGLVLRAAQPARV